MPHAISLETKALGPPLTARKHIFLSLKRDLGPVPRAASHRHLLNPRLGIPALERLEPLHQPNGNVVSLRQRVLLPQAHPRAAAKRQVVPAWSQRRVRPALRSEDLGVGAESRGLAHHGVGVVHYAVAFGDEEGLEAVFTTAVGQDCVFEGELAEDGDWGEEAESWLAISEGLSLIVVEKFDLLSCTVYLMYFMFRKDSYEGCSPFNSSTSARSFL